MPHLLGFSGPLTMELHCWHASLLLPLLALVCIALWPTPHPPCIYLGLSHMFFYALSTVFAINDMLDIYHELSHVVMIDLKISFSLAP